MKFVRRGSGVNWLPGLRKVYLRWIWRGYSYQLHFGLSGRRWHSGFKSWKLS
jgi:hypothetical protein